MDIIVFGVGNTGKRFYEYEFDRLNDRIVVAVDNNKQLWGKSVDYYKTVVSPDDVNQYEYDYIVIASIYKNSIIEQLKKYVPDDKVLSIDDYKRAVYSRKRYQNQYGYSPGKNTDILLGKTVVYTSITGNYDQLFDPLFVTEGVDYVCFTNNRNISSNTWNVEYVDDNDLSDMYLARKIKVFPNNFFPEYEMSIWVDGKFQIIENIIDYICLYQKTEPILCFPHFSRNCIYEEAARCIADGIGYKPDIIHQVSNYFENNYPFDNGLYETGCIVRRHNDGRVVALMERWWNELLKYSYRDQISFPYVCWKLGIIPDICDLNIYRNRWLYCQRNYSKAMGKL